MGVHLTPETTPVGLIPALVLVELTSLFIRPLTLFVRLMANIIAGHILLILLRNFYLIFPFFIFNRFIIILLILVLLEICVSLIQSYVFSILISLYINPYTPTHLC